MKYLPALLLIIPLLFSCNEEKGTEANILEKIANANGINNWQKVDELRFTFNVDRDSSHFERSWIWQPKTGKVTMDTDTETVTYTRGELDSSALRADKAFVNDVYWLLAPYKLVWDEGFSFDPVYKDLAPISQDSLNKLSIVYTGDGGYTPGDGYDFYFDDNQEIKEWVYRENNTTEVCMTTTWEDYQTFEGLKIATMHQNESGSFKLYFTNIEVSAGPREKL